MTARAIIEQIKALPPDEQAKVLEFLEKLKSVYLLNTIKTETFEDSSKRVFDRHAKLMRKLSQ